MGRTAVVFDLDGTLADLRHRRHLVEKKHPEWDKFLDLCDQDLPINWVIDLAKSLAKSDVEIFILSGRMESVRMKTINWLSQFSVPYNHLIMRPVKNYEPDDVLKPRLLKEHVLDKGFNLWFIVDDRQKVVDSWRKLGYNVLQCDSWAEIRNGKPHVPQKQISQSSKA